MTIPFSGGNGSFPAVVAQEAADRLGVLLERHQLDSPLHATAPRCSVRSRSVIRCWILIENG